MEEPLSAGSRGGPRLGREGGETKSKERRGRGDFVRGNNFSGKIDLLCFRYFVSVDRVSVVLYWWDLGDIGRPDGVRTRVDLEMWTRARFSGFGLRFNASWCSICRSGAVSLLNDKVL